MKFKMVHNNFNVRDLEKSLDFYAKALDLYEVRRKTGDHNEYNIVYLANENAEHQLELTWLRDWDGPYNLEITSFILRLRRTTMKALSKKHQEMGCVCFVNEEMGIYFIEDPDGYWLEILPE